ncbi:MAG: helix-turn-helix domain-containing protein [Propionibacteriaceae bacterium]
MSTPPPSESEQDLQPVESELLDAQYRKSGLTVADLAKSTGISVGAIRIALSGVRYRDGQPRRVVPPDQTVAKLAAVLGLSPKALTGIGRSRAAAILAEGQGSTVSAEPDLNSVAAIAGRQSVVRQMLAIVSTEELRAELDRRTAEDNEAMDAAAAERREADQ